MKKALAVMFVSLILSGCANSASHQVVQSTKGSDTYLDCTEIRMELVKVEQIIEGVYKDKTDMTGRDVVDGLLWFPFNVMAKQSNYSNALEAANKRVEFLTILAKERKCTNTAKTTAAIKMYREKLEAEALEKKSQEKSKKQFN